MALSRRQLKEVAVEAPENLVLLDNDGLMRLCRNGTCDEQLQGNCLAELYERWFVGDSAALQSVEKFLFEMTPGGLPPKLLVKRATQDLMQADEVRELLASPLWTGADEDWRCIELSVRERLRRLLVQVDGWVPVYNIDDTDGGRFIPFEIVPRRAGRSPWAVDVEGKAIKKWDRPAREILGDSWQLRVFYRQRKDMPQLLGRSLLLPLQVALWRKTGEIPKFNSWQLLFTGDIDAGGRTVPVKTEEKAAAVGAAFQSSVRLVAPSDAPYAGETRGVDPIASGIGGEQLLAAIRSKVEQLRGCCFSREYATRRLPWLEREIRHETVGEWEGQIACVDALLRVMGRHVAPREYLRLVMLKSAALCHSGKTKEAMRENVRALALAREKGLSYEALRLEIEQLVEFQDSQRFDEVARLARPLFARISKEQLTDEARFDLLMRYHGTMGQIQMEKALLGLERHGERQAKANLEKARGYASRLGRDGDILQDLNYLHLWHAFFDPRGEETAELALEMSDFSQALESEGERVKNQAYQRRQLAVAAFMKWRTTGEVPSDWSALKPPPAGSESWLIASFLKMKGALAAAAGDAEQAKACFSEGEQGFPMREWWNGDGDVLSAGPVFAQIRMSLLVQAACSLAELGLAAESSDYCRMAQELFDGCPSLIHRAGAEVCRQILSARQLPDPRTLPVFYY